MKKYLIVIVILLQSILASNKDKLSENNPIQAITNRDDIIFYKSLLKNYFFKLPSNIVIRFTYDNDTHENSNQNIGNIYIDKNLKKIRISDGTFYIYNENEKFFLKDIELNEINMIEKPKIVDLFFNNNIESILQNAKLFKRDNRLSCKIELRDSIGSNTIILSFNINHGTQLELKFWNIKNEYMKNKIIKIIKIEKF